MADATSINVSKEKILELLRSGAEKKFIIPEYQRPYAWTDDEVNTLMDDLIAYNTATPKSDYFLGCIVTYDNAEGDQEVIDGQQRLTTLFLLMRALYSKLETSSASPERSHLMPLIASTLWVTNDTTGIPSRDQILIETKAINDNSSLDTILKTGESPIEAKDNYAQNYRLLQNRIEQYIREEPLIFYSFVANLLNRVIVLPINADSQDTALRIFNTLNDRGLPLSDADIFKSQLYSSAGIHKDQLINDWQELEADAARIGVTMQTLFTQNMFIMRATEGDHKTTTPAVRTYYGAEEFDRLKNKTSLDDLRIILNLWQVVYLHESLEHELWSKNSDILQVLDILNEYPNEFWKYPAVTYYWKYHTDLNFENKFLPFLRHLTAELIGVYALSPTVNSIKQSVLNLDERIIKTSTPTFEFKKVDIAQFEEELATPHYRLVRPLLKLVAYANPEQRDLLPEKWEIEHIFPQKWDPTHFPQLSNEQVRAQLEHLGNKTPLEKKLNIQAGNGFFSRKRQQYRQSTIAVTNQLAYQCSTWEIDDITKRDEQLTDLISNTLQQWGLS